VLSVYRNKIRHSYHHCTPLLRPTFLLPKSLQVLNLYHVLYVIFVQQWRRAPSPLK